MKTEMQSKFGAIVAEHVGRQFDGETVETMRYIVGHADMMSVEIGIACLSRVVAMSPALIHAANALALMQSLQGTFPSATGEYFVALSQREYAVRLNSAGDGIAEDYRYTR